MFLERKLKANLKRKIASNTVPTVSDNDDAIVKSLYEKNIEIVHKNKALSLLSRLYEIGILTLEPKELAAQLSQTVLTDLNFELVGILYFDSQVDSLIPLAFSKTKRVQDSLKKQNMILEEIIISNVIKRKFFKKAVYLKKANVTHNLKEIWGELINPKKMQSLVSESHIKSILLYPLIVESKVLGVFIVALNRDYMSINNFEKESIKNLTNVVALALEKAYLYQQLQIANAQLREIDKQKDELLGIVSHQLAAPVTAIKWYLELMMDEDVGSLNQDQQKQIRTIQSVTLNLSDLVSMILDVSRVQLGRVRVEPQELNLKEFVEEICQVVEPKVKEKSIKLSIQIQTSLPIVFLDKRLTRMTIENLLTNAVKYTPANGEIDFLLQIKDEVIHFEIRDTGMGIPLKEQSKIFEKLYRASNVRNTIEGNGFGLYVAKGGVEAQGGKISFDSHEGKGTTFYIDLPLRKKK